MTKRLLTLLLAGLLLNLAAVAPVAHASTKDERRARFAEKVREGVRALGVGESARVELKLRDRTRLKGYVSAASDEGFSVTDAGGSTTAVAYAQVAQVKGHNLSTGARVAIGVGVVIGVLLLIFIIFHDEIAAS